MLILGGSLLPSISLGEIGQSIQRDVPRPCTCTRGRDSCGGRERYPGCNSLWERHGGLVSVRHPENRDHEHQADACSRDEQASYSLAAILQYARFAPCRSGERVFSKSVLRHSVRAGPWTAERLRSTREARREVKNRGIGPADTTSFDLSARFRTNLPGFRVVSTGRQGGDPGTRGMAEVSPREAPGATSGGGEVW